MPGPLAGVRVIELGGLGPGPHAAMILADFGAEVVRVIRPGAGPGQSPGPDAWEPRGCQNLALDLKAESGRQRLLGLVAAADVLIEGFRPGVAERLGIGPGTCLELNPRLTYGRVTGWGQDGPYAQAAGHDINYLALSGLLHAIGPAAGPPVPPLNLVGDFGGGSMLLAVGVLAALVERNRSGRGQVIDAAMLDGAVLLGDLFIAWRSGGLWTGSRGGNLFDGGAPFYRAYECSDGRYVAVGAVEPQFFAELVAVLGIQLPAGFDHLDRANWPALGERLAAAFRERDRDHWDRAFEGRDACVTPVLSLDEMPAHPHVRARQLVVERSGIRHAAPAPRFSRTPAEPHTTPVGLLDAAELAARWQARPAAQPGADPPVPNRRTSSCDHA